MDMTQHRSSSERGIPKVEMWGCFARSGNSIWDEPEAALQMQPSFLSLTNMQQVIDNGNRIRQAPMIRNHIVFPRYRSRLVKDLERGGGTFHTHGILFNTLRYPFPGLPVGWVYHSTFKATRDLPDDNVKIKEA